MKKIFLAIAVGVFAAASAWAIQLININPNAFKETIVYTSSAGSTVTLAGVGYSYAVQPTGGAVTFKVSGGSSMTLTNGQAFGDTFGFFKMNPSIIVTALDPNTTVFVYISGGESSP